MNEEPVKVHIKGKRCGESFWAIPVDRQSDTRMTAKVDNYLVLTGEHGLSYGDLATFELRQDIWERVLDE